MGEIIGLVAVALAGLVGVWLGWSMVKAVGDKLIEWERARVDIRRLNAEVQLAVLRPGEIKIPYHELSNVVVEQMRLAVAHIEAMRLPANVPHTLHYAPHIRQVEARPIAQLPQAPAALVNDDIPSAMDCFARGMFDDPDQLLIGFNENGAPIYSAVEDTYGVAVAGVPKMGKTTGMRFLAVQMALHGAQMAIIDPAANSASQQGLAANLSGLRDHLWEQPAADANGAIRMLKRIEAIGMARNRGQDTSTWPLMLMIDELTSLITGERGDEVAALIMRVNRQFRKERIYTIAAGQDWLNQALGGDVGLRRSFVCKAVYRADADNGRKLSVRKPLIDMVPALQRGQMVWIDAYANQSLVTVPDCSTGAVAAILGTSPVKVKDSHTGTGMITDGVKGIGEVVVEVGGEVDGEVVLDPGKLRQIRDYGVQGWSTHRITKVVFGVEGGKAYGNARDTVNQVLGREI